MTVFAGSDGLAKYDCGPPEALRKEEPAGAFHAPFEDRCRRPVETTTAVLIRRAPGAERAALLAVLTKEPLTWLVKTDISPVDFGNHGKLVLCSGERSLAKLQAECW
jgi:hypothetical protein